MCTSEFSGAACDCQTSKETCRGDNGVSNWVNVDQISSLKKLSNLSDMCGFFLFLQTQLL